MDEGQTVVFCFADVTTIRVLVGLYLYCCNPRNSTPERGFILSSKRETLQHELSPMATLIPQNLLPLIQIYHPRTVTLPLARTLPRNSTWEKNQNTGDENKTLWTEKNPEFFSGVCMSTGSVWGFHSFLPQKTRNNKAQGSILSLSISSHFPITSLVSVCFALALVSKSLAYKTSTIMFVRDFPANLVHQESLDS